MVGAGGQGLGELPPDTPKCYCNVNFQEILWLWLWLPPPGWATHRYPGKGGGEGHHDAGQKIRGTILWLLACATVALVTPGSGLSLPLCFQYYLQCRPHLFHF